MTTAEPGKPMILRRLFTLVGAGLITAGAFIPFLSVPIFKDDAFIELSRSGGLIVIACVILSLGCVFYRRFALLYLTGGTSLVLVIFTIYQVNARKTAYITDFNRALEGSPLKGIGLSFVRAVDITHGAALMLAGAVILICVPLLGGRITLRKKSAGLQ